MNKRCEYSRVHQLAEETLNVCQSGVKLQVRVNFQSGEKFEFDIKSAELFRRV